MARAKSLLERAAATGHLPAGELLLLLRLSHFGSVSGLFFCQKGLFLFKIGHIMIVKELIGWFFLLGS